MRRKVFELRLPVMLPRVTMDADQFDWLLDAGYDDILVITPIHRYIASLDEWLDFGYVDSNENGEFRVLPKAYFGLV